MALKKMQGELNTFSTTTGVFEVLCKRLRKAKENGMPIPDTFFERKTPEQLDQAWEENRQKAIEEAHLASLEYEKKVKEAKIQEILGRASIPTVFADKTFEQLQNLDKHTLVTVNMLKDFVVHYETQKGRNFVFFGRWGTGKTHLACATLKELMSRYEVIGIYINLTELINKVRFGFSRNVSQGETLQAFKEAEVLVIDEIGAQIGSAFELALLQEVLLARYDSQLSTILITNMNVLRKTTRQKGDPAEYLSDFLDPRVMSRVNEKYEIRLFDGKSYRTPLGNH